MRNIIDKILLVAIVVMIITYGLTEWQPALCRAQMSALEPTISEATASAQPAAEIVGQTQEEILQRQRLAQEIDDVQARLLVELDQYQQDEKQYRIGLDQFQRLQTLSSIEGATKTAKKAMLSRNQVLLTYSNLMRLKLIEAEGIEVTQKQDAIASIERHMQQLKVFAAELNQADNRDQINELADKFESLAMRVENNCYRALSLLAIGKLQAVYDQATAVYQQVKKQEVTDLNLLQQTQRQRALNEVDKLQSNIPPMFHFLWVEAAEKATEEEKFHSFYRGIFDDLNPIFSRLSQFVSYLEELEQVP